MASEKAPGFAVTAPRVAFLVSMIAVGMFLWNGAKAYLHQSFKLEAAEEYIVEDKAVTKEILTQLQKLDKKVDRLTFIVDPTTKQALAEPVDK